MSNLSRLRDASRRLELKIVIVRNAPAKVRQSITSLFPDDWRIVIIPDGLYFHKKRFQFFAASIKQMMAGKEPYNVLNDPQTGNQDEEADTRNHSARGL